MLVGGIWLEIKVTLHAILSESDTQVFSPIVTAWWGVRCILPQAACLALKQSKHQ